MWLTSGGNWDQQRNAEKLTAAYTWVADRQGMVSKGRRIAIDSMIGCGFGRAVTEHDGTVSLERCYPPDVLFDDAACVDAMPRDIYHRRYLDRAMLWELYDDPEQRRAIERAEPAGWALTNPHSSTADVIEVVEGWHLPSFQGEIDGRKAKDGHWALVIRSGTDRGAADVLDHGEYTRPHFPIVGMRSVKPSLGYWGIALIDYVACSHLELNKIMRRIAEMMHRNATNRTWLETGSHVSPADIQNTIGAIIQFTGRPPIFEAPNPVNPGVFDYTDRLESYGFKDAGVSQYAASSTIPANLESGRAQRIFREQQTLRQVDIFDEFGIFHCELARRWAEAEAQLSEDEPARRTPYEVDGCAETIEWSRVRDDLDSMSVAVMPTSGLAATPAARMQDIQDGVKEGTFTPEDSLRLSTDPDTKALREERLAPLNRLHKVLDGMLDGGPYVGPDPEMDLARGIELCLAKINAAVVRGCPAERVDNLRKWWPEAQAKLQEAQAAAAPPPGAEMPMVGPGAGAMPPELGGAPPGLPPAGAPLGGEGALPPMMPPEGLPS
jgi:hypothetical protein